MLSESPRAKPSGTQPTWRLCLRTISGKTRFDRMNELLEADKRVAEANALIERNVRLLKS